MKHSRNNQWSGLLASTPVLALALALALAPAPAQAQFCFGTSVYHDLSDEGASFPICHDGVLTCQEPELQIQGIVLDPPDCDQTWQACTVTATVDTKFPGNHQNDPSLVGFGYSFGALLLETIDGSLVDACGTAGAAIQRDVGRFIHSAGVPCVLAKEDPPSFQLRLKALMCPCAPGIPFCPWQASCEKEAEVILDFVLPKIECPPKNECCDACGECLEVGSGGADKSGTTAGICKADNGPGARLRYIAGGAGSENLPGSPAWAPVLGRGWSHDYAERLVRHPDDRRVWLITRFGSFREFRDSGGDGDYEFVSPSDEKRRLRKDGGGWQLEETSGTVHSFDSAGRWLSTLDPGGVGKAATYGAGGLTRVDLPDGRHELFTYHPGGKLATIAEVGIDGTSTRTWSYLWAGDDLVEVLRPDGTRFRYRYQDPRHPGYMTQSILVGTDGSERIETAWQYDRVGRAVRVWKGDVVAGPTGPLPGPNALDVWSMSFTEKDEVGLVTESMVTDPLGQVSTYRFSRDAVSAKPRMTSYSGDCPNCGLGPDSQLLYDDPANPMLPTRVIDAHGAITRMTYDGRGRMTSRTEAMGTALERTTTWEYDDTTQPSRVAAIEQPSTSGSGVRRTSWTYDGAGNATIRTEEGVENGSAYSHQTVTAYNPAGRPESIDPPGYGTGDRTTMTYDPARGGLVVSTRTEPLTGTTAFEYDPFNRLTRVTDPNGRVVELVLDPLGRVETMTEKGAVAAEDLVTTYEFGPLGDLIRETHPRGNVIEYGRDALGRLLSIERRSAAGVPVERMVMTLNDLGQRVREELQSWNGSGWQVESSTDYDYSSSCQIDRIAQADGSVVEFGYGCDGRLENEWDANHPSGGGQNPPSTSYTYDPLNRVASVRQPWGGAGGGTVTTTFGYDVQNNLARIVDANGTLAERAFSDRGLMTRETSEVAGTKLLAYNQHGQLTRITDARNVTVERSFDAADRVTFADYPGADLDVTYVYHDAAVPYSLGRLTSIRRDGDSVDYRYDRFGRMVQDGDLAIEYDENGNRARVTYPGGVAANYTYDASDRQRTLAIEVGAGPPIGVVGDAGYEPFGPLAALTLANGLSETRSFTARYFPQAITVPGRFSWTYATDALGQVTSIADAVEPASSRSFGYQDYQYYLTSAGGPWGDLAWTYDRLGNRLAEERDGDVTDYAYRANQAGGSLPQLDGVQGADPAARERFFYDPSGHLTHRAVQASKLRYDYDAAGRLAQIRRDAAGDVASVALSYDGRSFLESSRFTNLLGSGAETWQTEATYGSQGVLYRRSFERRALPSSERQKPAENGEDFLFYFSGRPVAQLSRVTRTPPAGTPTSEARLLFLTTDAVGAPVLATDDAGGVVWRGGFEPFGAAFDDTAREAGIFLRLPGQWVDDTWADELQPDMLYNVMRWLDAGTGLYSRPDPVAAAQALDATEFGLNPYQYALNNPMTSIDPTGLVVIPADLPIRDRCRRKLEQRVLPRLRDLANNQDCTEFFCQKLDTDLDQLLSSSVPVLLLADRPLGGQVFCHLVDLDRVQNSPILGPDRGSAEAARIYRQIDPSGVFVGRRSLCGSPDQALQVILHELGHYADCWNKGNSYRDEFDGCCAEVACFGGSIGGNCGQWNAGTCN